MKKIYICPEMDICAFSTENIVTMSGGDFKNIDAYNEITSGSNPVNLGNITVYDTELVF